MVSWYSLRHLALDLYFLSAVTYPNPAVDARLSRFRAAPHLARPLAACHESIPGRRARRNADDGHAGTVDCGRHSPRARTQSRRTHGRAERRARTRHAMDGAQRTAPERQRAHL